MRWCARAAAPTRPATRPRDLIVRELRLLGSTMGTAADLDALLAFLVHTGLRPRIGIRTTAYRPIPERNFVRISTSSASVRTTLSPSSSPLPVYREPWMPILT